MPISPSGATVWRDYVTDGVPATGVHKVYKPNIRRWSTAVEQRLELASTAAKLYATRAALYADLTENAATLAWVYGDTTTAHNGLYTKVGASGFGSWTRIGDLPYSFVKMSDTGAGTANAIQVTSSIPTSDSVLRISNVFEANTGNVTISENGGAAKALLNNSGNQIVPGGLTAGMMIAYVDGGSAFRLVSDQASAAIQAAAEAAAAEAHTQAELAASYASSVGEGTGLLSFSTIATLIADDKLSYTSGTGLVVVTPGRVVTAQGFRYVVAPSAASDHQFSTAGGVKLYEGEPSAGNVNTNYSVQLTDQGRMLLVDATSGDRVITLLSAAIAGNGFRLIFQKSDPSANFVTIDGNGSETIDGQQTYNLFFPRQSVALVCTGTGWRVMSSSEVFETGVTPTGEYEKRADGWMTCTYRNPYTDAPTNSAAGSIFMSPGISPGSFPVPYVTPPAVHHSGKPGGVNGWTMCAVGPTAVNWGTYRTASYVTDESRAGTLMLVAEGRWGGAAGGAGTLVLKAGASEESLIIARRGADTITRGFRWNAPDTFQMGDDQYPVFSLTTDAVNGLSFRTTNDDIAPYLVNGSHRGGVHSLYGCRLNTGAHGKTQADIGSIWANGGVQYVLLRIMSANQLFVARLDSDVDAPTGTYTHVSGATNTASFPCGLSARESFYPMISNRAVSIAVDGATVSGTSGVWSYSDSVVFTETYDVLDRSEVIDWFRANGSGGTLNVTGDPLFSVEIDYRFDSEGNLTIAQTFTAEQSITINRLYGLQMQLSAATGFYVPKATAFIQAGTTLDYANIETSVTNPSEVILDTTKTLAGGLYLDRAVSFNGNNGLAVGFLPVQIAEPVSRRSTYVTSGSAGISIATNGKMYLSAVSKGNHVLTAGQTYSFTGYRNPVIRDATRTDIYAVRSEQGDFLYVDWHDKAFTDAVPVPADFVGKSFAIVEKSANVTASAGVFAETLAATVAASGTYGYLVLKVVS